MKKILTLLLVSVGLISCDSFHENYYKVTNKTIRVLNKGIINRGELPDRYELQIYNGEEAIWYETDEKTYELYKINDTLHTLILQDTKFERTLKDSVKYSSN